MYLKKLQIKNFQIHKNLEVEFTDGLNVIVGESSKGKSSIIRALTLLLMNTPRGAEKLFLKKGSKKDSLEIVLEDSNGNELSRKKRTYYLNDIEYNAFNNEIPLPIQEQFPITKVNLQKQLDQPFLIMNTAGQVANTLSKITGLEEQNEISKEIKDKISETKSEIKRLNTTLKEDEEKIEQLKCIPEYLNKAITIQECYEEISDLNDVLSDVKLIISKVKKCSDIIETFKDYNIKHFENKIEKIKGIYIEKNNKQIVFNKLKEVVSELKDINIKDVDIDGYKARVNSLRTEYKRINNIDNKNITLFNLVSDYRDKEMEIESIKKEIQITQNSIREYKKGISICPLCDKPF